MTAAIDERTVNLTTNFGDFQNEVYAEAVQE
jgi:hypothetical protein